MRTLDNSLQGLPEARVESNGNYFKTNYPLVIKCTFDCLSDTSSSKYTARIYHQQTFLYISGSGFVRLKQVLDVCGQNLV